MSQKTDPQEIYYGPYVILSLLESDQQLNKLFLQRGLSKPEIQSIIKLARQKGIVIQEAPKQKLDELCQGKNHQGVVATVPPYRYQSLEDCFALADSRNEEPFLILLDGVEDPYNLGSIIRTAGASGAHGVIIPKRRSASLTSVVAKTAAGAITEVPIVRVTNLVQTIERLKDRQVWVFASDLKGEDMRRWNSQGPIAIVIGNEGQGVSPTVVKASDGAVRIPMTDRVESLNASVAAAIMMYEVARDRL